jgi:outer membrane murein-binding lipoprotein Lpp
MKMKKGFTVFSVILTVLLISGCSSAPTVYDKSVPLEQSSNLILVSCTVMDFDGKFLALNSNWRAHSSLGSKQIIIPSGTHTFSVYAEYRQSGSGRILQVQYEPFHIEFLQGHTYAVQKNSLTSENGVRITDVTELLKEFVPNSSGSDALLLEGKWESNNDKDGYIFSGNQFVTFSGKYQGLRGFFSIKDDKVHLTTLVYYNRGKEKWVVNFMAGSYALQFDGITLVRTTLFGGEALYKKSE